MILHILTASPFSHDAWQRCQEMVTAQDGILLTEDAVLALSNPAAFLKGLPTPELFVLGPDCLSRGVAVPDGYSITTIDYDGFVTLTTRFDKTISWF